MVYLPRKVSGNELSKATSLILFYFIGKCLTSSRVPILMMASCILRALRSLYSVLLDIMSHGWARHPCCLDRAGQVGR